MDDNNDEFQAAFAAEFSESPPVETTLAPTPEPSSEEETPVAADTAPAAEPAVPPTPEADPSQDKPAEGDGEGGENAGEQPPAPQYATKDDVRKALEEDRQAMTERTEMVSSMKEAVIKQLHPDGIDRNLYDSQNRVINTAQDIVDRGLINPDTQEPFSYEEAARWMMNAQKEMNEQISAVETFADKTADLYVDLYEGNNRVEELYGEYLKVMPGVAKQLSEQYFATLVKDDNGIVTKVQYDPVEFYANALAPYIKMAEMAVKQQDADAARQAEEAKRQADNDRDERMGLPQRGHSRAKPNTGDPFLDELLNEMEA